MRKKQLTKRERELIAMELATFFRGVMATQDKKHLVYWDNVYKRVQWILNP